MVPKAPKHHLGVRPPTSRTHQGHARGVSEELAEHAARHPDIKLTPEERVALGKLLTAQGTVSV